MGTRHLTTVVKNGEFKVAQYGQWDGYPNGQGATIVEFINDTMNDSFKKALDEVQFVTYQDHIKALWTECGADPDSDFVNMAVSEKFREKYPEFSRDTGAGVLELIQNGAKKLKSDLDFAGDSLFCEWAYVVNMDDEVLEIYEGFNKEKPVGRFAGMKGDDKYEPVTLHSIIPFSELDSTIMADLEKELYSGEES